MDPVQAAQVAPPLPPGRPRALALPAYPLTRPPSSLQAPKRKRNVWEIEKIVDEVRSPRAPRPHPAPLRAPARPPRPTPPATPTGMPVLACYPPIAPCAPVPMDSQPSARGVAGDVGARVPACSAPPKDTMGARHPHPRRHPRPRQPAWHVAAVSECRAVRSARLLRVRLIRCISQADTWLICCISQADTRLICCISQADTRLICCISQADTRLIHFECCISLING